MANALVNFVDHYGIFAVFLLMALESCGIPIPSEVIMPAAGYFVAVGHLSAVGAVLAGTVGNLAGSLIAYGLAARFGLPLLLGPGRKVGISKSHIELADRWFQRHGNATVFFGRMLPVIRTYVSFPAGLAKVDVTRFALLTFAGALPWCIALTAGGYALKSSYDKLSHPIELAAIVIGLLVVGGIVWWFVHGRHLAARRRETSSGPS